MWKVVPTFFLHKMWETKTWGKYFSWCLDAESRNWLLMLWRRFSLNCLCCLSSFFHNYTLWYKILNEKGKWSENVLEGHPTHYSRRASGILQGPYFLLKVHVHFCCRRYAGLKTQNSQIIFQQHFGNVLLK